MIGSMFSSCFRYYSPYFPYLPCTFSTFTPSSSFRIWVSSCSKFRGVSKKLLYYSNWLISWILSGLMYYMLVIFSDLIDWFCFCLPDEIMLSLPTYAGVLLSSTFNGTTDEIFGSEINCSLIYFEEGMKLVGSSSTSGCTVSTYS